MKRILLFFFFYVTIVMSISAQTWNCGYCGTTTSCEASDDVTATLSNDTLFITGKARMKSYDLMGNTAPWYGSRSNIHTIILDDGLESIGNYAFTECAEITTLAMPNSITTVGNYAFFSCGKLDSVIVGDGVETIGESAFMFCSGLTSIKFGNKVKTIEGNAFSMCGKLSSIEFPKSLETIGNSAFFNCGNLKKIVNLNPVPQALSFGGESVFLGTTDITTCELFVPHDAVETYKRSFGWSMFGAIRAIDYSVAFHSQGGSKVDSQRVKYGEKVEKPNVPTREKHLFAGWYREAKCILAWDFDKDTVTEDITLYAKWEEEKDTVTDTIEPPSRLYTVENSTPTFCAWISAETLHIHGLTPCEKWQIYTISGMLLQQGIAQSSEVEIPCSFYLQKNIGICVIRVGRKSLKIGVGKQ